MFAACLEDLPASPCPSYRRPVSTSSAGRSPEIICALPNITYTDRVLEGLPEVDEAEKGSMLKSDGECTDECKGAMSPEPRLKPERQFYRSAPRPSIGRPPGLHPAIWRMVVFQLAFFFILILATLSTLIDLIRDRPVPTAFGTQDIAILLVAWCPAIIFSSFGFFPGVCNPLLPRHSCA